MKKYLYLLVLMFQVCFVFGQTPQWSSWGKVSCFQGFQFAVLNKGFVKSINQYSWQAKIKSNYSKKVTFNMSWKVGGEVVSIGQVTLSPGQEYSHTSRYFNSNANYLSVEVSSVNFSDKLNCYANCDNGVPNQPNCDTKTNTGSNTANNNTQQYDPAFDRNNASFQDYYKRATAAGQSGNYDQAISLWNSAISVAVNDAQRNNARAWLAEAQKAKANSSASNNNNQQRQTSQAYVAPQQTKAQRQAQTLNVLSNSLIDLAKSFDKAKAEKKEKQQREAEARRASISFMERAEAEASKGTDEGYSNAVSILLPRLNELDGDGLNTLGFYYWKQKDYTNSFKYFKMSAAKGSDIGIYDLAYAYENGHGTTVDKNIAFHYYTKISPNYNDMGSVYHQLGHLCEEGANNDRNKPDFQMAFGYFSKGAEIGSGTCMFHLGDYYHSGGKITTDLKMAKYWYQKACDKKINEACEKLKALQ